VEFALTKMGLIDFHKKVWAANLTLVISDHDLAQLTAESIPIHRTMPRNTVKLSSVTDRNALDPACRETENHNETEACILKPSVFKRRNTHTT
jgi:hypothetical protein